MNAPTRLLFLLQVGLQRNRSKHACKSPHECVIRVTGPLAYTSGVGSATHAPGACRNRLRTPRRGECARAESALLREMFLCERDAGTIWNSWSCGFAVRGRHHATRGRPSQPREGDACRAR